MARPSTASCAPSRWSVPRIDVIGSGPKVINLRAARKSAARDAARRQGDQNAAKFGRSKAQRQAEDDAAARAARHLDQHMLGPDRRDDGDGDA
ncbi:DUF4169 family protein [Paracoccus yeei]|uniref:DUF4169 family protein n=1 Tax=Paracoccus yeei TaxID=147645 RepID=A0A5P2QX09_9RHOB|nr:DUF4169 family protein [Paracoccus yeei]